MANIVRTKLIKAKAETIFDIYDNPNIVAHFSGVVSNIVVGRRTKKRLGDTIALEFRLGPTTFKEQMTITAYKRPTFFSQSVTGMLDGTLTLSIVDLAAGVKAVFLSVEYKAAGLKKLEDKLVIGKEFKRGMDNLLSSLKSMAEGGMASDNAGTSVLEKGMANESIVLTREIRAPPERIFDAFDSPTMMAEFSSIVSNVAVKKRSKKKLGDQYVITFKLGPMTFKERLDVIEFKRPSFISANLSGFFDGTLIFSVANVADGMQMVFLSVVYQTTGLKRLGDALIMNTGFKRGIENLLDALKVMSEGGVTKQREVGK